MLESDIDKPAVSESVTVTLYLNCAPDVVVSRVVVVYVSVVAPTTVLQETPDDVEVSHLNVRVNGEVAEPDAVNEYVFPAVVVSTLASAVNVGAAAVMYRIITAPEDPE